MLQKNKILKIGLKHYNKVFERQIGVCEEYIATVDVKQYASDMDSFVPLMEKFNKIYGKYPKYPIADAGYGSYNNYLYCEEHEMEKEI